MGITDIARRYAAPYRAAMPSPTERLKTAVSDRYRIEDHLGEGGMATVYLAHDLKHDRKVALKVLRPELAAVIGAERFLAEIRTTANLQHPNILPLFDSGDADGQLFYVMPYVEGETLRDRITHEKQLPVDDVVRLGAEVASALDYAHRQGVIHRDIKPENILVHDGRALVADFGIALAVSTAGSRMTETGMSVGTPHYMSPEQAMGGHDVTAKSDVYALGATLYEALVGEPPFTGPTAQAVIARIVTEDPRPLVTQRKTVPPHVEGAVLTALERLPADRFATAAEFGEALEGRGRGMTRVTTAAAARAGRRDTGLGVSRGARFAVVSVILVLAATALWGWLRPLPEAPVQRTQVNLGMLAVPSFVVGAAAIAPDGSAIVYPDTVGGLSLWIKERGALDPVRLVALPRNISAPPSPSFSPDGEWIVYTDGKLEKVARGGGAPITLSDSLAGNGAAWLDDGTIIFNGAGARLLRTNAAGEPSTVVLTSDSVGGTFLRPVPVPGAQAVLVAAGNGQGVRVVALDLKTGAVHEVVSGVVSPGIVTGNVMVYAQANGTLMAAPFDRRRLALSGPPVAVQAGIRSVSGIGVDVVVGADGTMLYAEGRGASAGLPANLVSVARDGSAVLLDSAWSAPLNGLGGVDLSPDGTRVALTVSDSEGSRSDIYVVQLPAGPPTRLTFEGDENIRPAWSPDGTTVLYVSDAGGKEELWTRRADGSGRPVRVVSEGRSVFEGAWSPDGQWIVYRTDDVARGRGDILAVRTQGDTTPVSLVSTEAEETGPAVSPDGRWLAYTATISDRPEVFVVPFPDAQGGLWQVSEGGGSEARWSADGRELFYRGAGGRLVAVEVSGTPTFRAGAQRALFEATLYAANPDTHFYAVSADGKRFVMLRPVADDASVGGARVVLVENWLREVRAKLKGR